MANVIQIKRSSTATNTPLSLAAGELAINTADEKLFYANAATTVKEVDLQAVATALQNVVEDTTPQLGGTLDAQGNLITDIGDLQLSYPGILQSRNNADTGFVNLIQLLDTTDIVEVGDTGQQLAFQASGGGTDADIKMNSQGAMQIPVGATAARPSVPTNGDIRYNSTTAKFEGYENGAWVDFTADTGLLNIVEDTTPQLGGDLDLNGNAIDFPTTANINDVISATDLTGASNTNLATALAIKTYVDTEVASAVTSAMVYQGTADASAIDVDTATGTATHNNGDLYKVTVAGSTAFGFQLNVGDFVVYNGVTWDRIDAVDANVSGTASRIAVTGNESVGFTVDIDAAYVGQASITTLGTITTGTWNGDTIAVANGGTGATTAAGARTNLGVDPAGTDNSTDVTIAAGLDYVTISGQELTLNQVDLATDVTGALDGGTF